MQFHEHPSPLFRFALLPLVVSTALVAGCDDSDGGSNEEEEEEEEIAGNIPIADTATNELVLVDNESGELETRVSIDERYAETTAYEFETDSDGETIEESGTPTMAIYSDGSQAYKADLREDADSHDPEAFGDVSGVSWDTDAKGTTVAAETSAKSDWYIFRPGPDTWIHALPLNGDNNTKPIEIEGVTDELGVKVVGEGDDAKVLVKTNSTINAYDYSADQFIDEDSEQAIVDGIEDASKFWTTTRDTAFIRADETIYTYHLQDQEAKSIHSFNNVDNASMYPAEDGEHLYFRDDNAIYRIAKDEKSLDPDEPIYESGDDGPSVDQLPLNAAEGEDYLVFLSGDPDDLEESTTLYSLSKEEDASRKEIFSADEDEGFGFRGVSEDNAIVEVGASPNSPVTCAPLDGADATNIDTQAFVGSIFLASGDTEGYHQTDHFITADYSEEGDIAGQPARLHDANGDCGEKRVLGNVPSDNVDHFYTHRGNPNTTQRLGIITHTDSRKLLWVDIEEADSLKVLDTVESPRHW